MQIESLWDEKVAEAKRRGSKLDAEVTHLRAQIAGLQASGAGQNVKLPDLSPSDGNKSGKDMPSRKVRSFPFVVFQKYDMHRQILYTKKQP